MKTKAHEIALKVSFDFKYSNSSKESKYYNGNN